MTTREKILNLLLKPFGLAVITQEDYENGRRATAILDRQQDLVNPKCKHGSRVNWCSECWKEEDSEERYYD